MTIRELVLELLAHAKADDECMLYVNGNKLYIETQSHLTAIALPISYIPEPDSE